MSALLETDGYEIRRKVLGGAEISALRIEADAVAESAGTACVRHLRARSGRMDELSRSPALEALLPAGLIPVRSILFDKTPKENWPVAWHQDLTIAVSEQRNLPGYGPWSFKDEAFHVQPPLSLLRQMVTLRLHLDDTPESNGALRVVPGSHRSGLMSPGDRSELSGGIAVTCECDASDVLLMSPLILHSSQRSQVPRRRRILHFEYAREDSLHPDLGWYETSGCSRAL